MNFWILTVLVPVLAFAGADHHAGHGDVTMATEKDLRRHLFEGQDYDKRVRPVRNPQHAVQSSLFISPTHVKDVDFLHQTVSIDFWMAETWEDEYLKWDPKDFGGIESLTLPSSEVWSPDFAVFTGIADTSIFPTVKTNVNVLHDGTVISGPPLSMKNSRCPGIKEGSNHIECVVSVLSWTHDIRKINLDIHKFANQSMDSFEDIHPEWRLVSVTASREVKTYSCCPDPYPILHFLLVLERKEGHEAPSNILK